MVHFLISGMVHCMVKKDCIFCTEFIGTSTWFCQEVAYVFTRYLHSSIFLCLSSGIMRKDLANSAVHISQRMGVVQRLQSWYLFRSLLLHCQTNRKRCYRLECIRAWDDFYRNKPTVKGAGFWSLQSMMIQNKGQETMFITMPREWLVKSKSCVCVCVYTCATRKSQIVQNVEGDYRT